MIYLLMNVWGHQLLNRKSNIFWWAHFKWFNWFIRSFIYELFRTIFFSYRSNRTVHLKEYSYVFKTDWWFLINDSQIHYGLLGQKMFANKIHWSFRSKFQFTSIQTNELVFSISINSELIIHKTIESRFHKLMNHQVNDHLF